VSLYELLSVRMTHGGRTILDVDALRLEEGRAYSLQGSNGAGKSTLLSILGFLQPPHGGQVRFMDQPVGWHERELRSLRQQVGFVEQHPVMFSRSVRENVAFGLRLRGHSESEIERRVRGVLDRVDLLHLIDAHAPRLSGGETQRVALARALAYAPRVLLLDEPTASVDVQNRIVIEQVIADLRDTRETTVVLCTHNRFQAWALCPEVICLEGGRLAPRPLTNAFACRFQRSQERFECRIAEGFVVQLSGPAQGRGRVVINPEGVRITPAVGPGCNCGPLIRARLEGGVISVTVDLGLPLGVHMPLETFRALGLNLGDMVQVEIDSEALDYAEDANPEHGHGLAP
jgi:tungstate transport system ATP-binding protein